MKRRIGTRDQGQRRPNKQSIRFGPIECLESRTLLSISPHARIVNGHVVDQPGIVNGSPTSGFEAVGEVGDRSGPYCTGTLISTRFVLTAGHCAQGLHATQGRFFLDGSTYSTSHVYVHPNYNGNRIGFSDSANDVAIFELSVSVAGITPDPLFRGTPHVGDLLTLVGFGATGNGSTGHDNSFGIKRAGTTPIDSLTQGRVLWSFDNNHESNTAPGDSGGPAYLDVGGVYYIAGITSGGDRADAAIGDHSYDTRVDYYASWIDSIVGTTGDPTPSPQPDPGPAPGEDDHADLPGSNATSLVIANGSIHATGSLEVAGDRDVFRVLVSASGNLTLDLGASAGSLDTLVRVYDSAGNLIASDDDSGPGTDSHISLLLQPGTYYVSAGAYNDAVAGDYALNGAFSSDDHADSFIGATPIALGSGGDGTASGAIGQAGDRDVFQFVAGRTGHLSIDLRANGVGLDPMLTVYDSRGRVVATNDDSGGTVDSHVSVKVRAGSTYYVQAAGYQTSHGAYSVELTPTVTARQGGLRSAVSAVWVVSRPSVSDNGEAPEVSTPEISESTHIRAASQSVDHSSTTYPAAPSVTQGHGSSSEDPFDLVLAEALCPSLESM